VEIISKGQLNVQGWVRQMKEESKSARKETETTGLEGKVLFEIILVLFTSAGFFSLSWEVMEGGGMSKGQGRCGREEDKDNF
jgi:hypothetical protein